MMTQKTKQDPWYITKRAEQLAIMVMTRYSEVNIIHNDTPDKGLDLLVSSSQTTGRIFGIVVKGTLDLQTFIRPDSSLPLNFSEQLRSRVGEYPFPVGIFVFDMITDRGRFGWIVEPVVNSSRNPELVKPTPIYTRPITNDEIQRVLDEVNAWYGCRLTAVSK